MLNKLKTSINNNGDLCLYLDMNLELIPENFKNLFIYNEDALFRYNQKIIDNTKDLVCCYKLHPAKYQILGLKGMLVLKKTLQYIKENNLISIVDIKCNTNDQIALAYSKVYLEGDFECDFITVNTFEGETFFPEIISYANSLNKGILSVQQLQETLTDISLEKLLKNCSDEDKTTTKIKAAVKFSMIDYEISA